MLVMKISKKVKVVRIELKWHYIPQNIAYDDGSEDNDVYSSNCLHYRMSNIN